MAASENITYTVLVRDKAGWQAMGASGDMQAALGAADDLFATRQHAGVKVDKQFYDDKNQRFVTTTILERAKSSRSTVPLLIVLALLGGLVSFTVTYAVVQRFL